MPSPSRDQALFLGVDGGGSKTCFVLLASSGEVVATHEAGGAYYLQIGLDGLRERLKTGLTQTLAKAGVAVDQITHAFFGLPAHGEDSRITATLDALPGEVLGHGRHSCGNDMICGWAGSLAGVDGVSITAGTGSIGYGERQGRTARVGGWGEVFGDEGSAYWIALGGLNLFSRMSDGRLPRGPLHAILTEVFHLTSDLDLSTRIIADYAPERDLIAALSRHVAEAAQAGDAQAIGLFERAAAELALLASSLRTQLGFADDEVVRVSYSGGVFRAGDIILRPFARALADCGMRFELVRPQMGPGVGAAVYAAKMAGAPLSQQAVERLRLSSAIEDTHDQI